MLPSIIDSVHWMGFDWGPNLYYASDYFGYLYEFAEEFVRRGLAYVDSLTAEEIREHEPHATGLDGLWVPETGIVDFVAVARVYAQLFQAAGGEIRLGGSPGIGISGSPRERSKRGIDCSSPQVYGWLGESKMTSVGASSITSPAYITAM